MFRKSFSRGFKIRVVLCVSTLLLVYSLQHCIVKESQNSRGTIQQDLKLTAPPESRQQNTTCHALISLVYLVRYPKIVRDFYACLLSICKHSSVTLTLHIVTESRSQGKVDSVIRSLKKDFCKDKVDVHYYKIGWVAQELEPFMDIFKDLFTSTPGSHFSDVLFFLSIISHSLFPNISRLILLDADLKFRSDIRQLWNKFEDFSPTNLIGIAHELQPVYRHIMHAYRNTHPSTHIGGPPPGGNPGFNSGVLLMDLERIRNSAMYQQYLLEPDSIKHLGEKYFFKGHLGDQGFYTLLSFENPELFYILPCTWNRQLCTWWEDKGYQGVFHSYHNCEGSVNVYHGNCGTAIPDD